MAADVKALRTTQHIGIVTEQLWQPVPGGSGTYIAQLSQALLAQGVHLTGIAARHAREVSAPAMMLPSEMAMAHSRLRRAALYEAWNRAHLPRAEGIARGIDLVHATTWAIPPTRLPLVVTVHDVAFLRAPEHFTARGNRYFKRSLARAIAEADAIVVPSTATADDCVKAGFAPSKITVIPHGVTPEDVSLYDLEQFRQRWNLHRPYVLWTGTREPRKNLKGLLQAFTRFSERDPDVDLVLVGPPGWGADETKMLADHTLKGRVHVLGLLHEHDLACAYAAARAFCFPSFWEGFGLPVLEAMAYGTPVVTSRGTCMEEICGDAGLVADPNDPDEIAAQLFQAVDGIHEDLAAASAVRARHFTWEKSAQSHAELYASTLEG